MADKLDLSKLYDQMLVWRVRMNLQHWRVRLHLEPALGEHVRGRCYWEAKLQDATVLINPLWPFDREYSAERTLVHELVHLKLADLGDPVPDGVEEIVVKLTDIYMNEYAKN